MTLEGIDVSRHQASTPGLAGLAFLIARATYGTFRDPMYATHVLAAHTRGLVVGAYHFGRHGHVADQVATFLDQAGDVDLYALDLESDGGNPPMTQAEAGEFIDRVQSRGVPIGLYHSTSGYPSLGQDWRWVADYRPLDEPPIAWDIWQWRGSPLDRDRFRGTVDELRSLGRDDMAQAPITSQAETIVTTSTGHPWYDIDGRTVVVSRPPALGPRRSPYGVGGKRAIFADPTPDGIDNVRIVLVTPATSVPVPPADVDRDEVLDQAAAAVLALKGPG